MRRLTVFVAVLLFFGAITAGAQTLTGTITGKVTDEQGGVLPGVTVTLTGRTGAQTTVTDEKGEYRFVGCPRAAGPAGGFPVERGRFPWAA